MDFWSSVKVLAKRWYILAMGLALTLACAFGVNLLVSPTYTAAGSVVLSVPPNLPDRAASANPYLAYGNLAVAARVVASAMNQPSVVREQKAKGAAGTFVVDLDPERSASGLFAAPIITVDSRADTPASAIRTVEVVTAGVQQLLADRQRALGAPQNTWITANTVIVPEEANRAIGSRLRALSAVMVLGSIATLSLVFALEGWSQGRARDDAATSERVRAALPPPTPPGPPPPGPPPAPPFGTCPMCLASFGSAEALAGHLRDEHDLGERAAPAPAPPRAARPPPTRARVAKKAAASPRPRAPKSPPSS